MRGIVYLFVTFMLILLSLPLQAQEPPPGLDFIAENSDSVAVLCYTPGADDSGFTLNADERFTLASTYKLVILGEMARQIDSGLIAPDERVPVEDVNAYWLPGTDGGMHQAWLDTLSPDQQNVTLADIAYGMIAFSSNAAPDYLLERLGTEGFPVLFEQFGLDNTDLPAGGYLGFYLAYDNHETGPVDLDSLDRQTLAAEFERLENLYLTDAAWKEAQQAYQQEKIARLTGDPDSALDELARQAAYFEAFGSKGSARDMLAIMEAAYSNAVFSDEAHHFMQTTLNWLMDVNPTNREIYDALGTKGGTAPAILTGAWYAAPHGNEPIALAIFYRNLPLELWSVWATNYAHQELEVQVVTGTEGCAIFD